MSSQFKIGDLVRHKLDRWGGIIREAHLNLFKVYPAPGLPAHNSGEQGWWVDASDIEHAGPPKSVWREQGLDWRSIATGDKNSIELLLWDGEHFWLGHWSDEYRYWTDGEIVNGVPWECHPTHWLALTPPQS